MGASQYLPNNTHTHTQNLWLVLFSKGNTLPCHFHHILCSAEPGIITVISHSFSSLLKASPKIRLNECKQKCVYSALGFMHLFALFLCKCRGKRIRKTVYACAPQDVCAAFLYAAREIRVSLYVSLKGSESQKTSEWSWQQMHSSPELQRSPRIKYLLWCLHTKKRMRRWWQRTEGDKGENRSRRSFVDRADMTVNSDA